MFMKILFTYFFLTSTIWVFAQNNSFVDNRDGNIYNTVQIKNTTWLKENLRFHTKKSYCPNFNKSDTNCDDGNFYLFEEAKEICPSGWSIPTLADWEDFISSSRNEKNLSRLLVNNPKKYSAVIMNGDTGFFDPSNILNLKPVGRVEGNKWRAGGIVDFWTNNMKLGDEKFHIHFTNRSIAGHAHKHHILDKENKIRKFAVRCVKNVD